MALVAAGVGIAIVPEGVARANSDVAVREIDVDVKREVGLAYSAARPPSETLQSFIAKLQRQRPKAGRGKSAGKRGRQVCTHKTKDVCFWQKQTCAGQSGISRFASTRNTFRRFLSLSIPLSLLPRDALSAQRLSLSPHA